MRTYAITGSASGIGAATRAMLAGGGDRVIGIDLHDADVTVDLSTEIGCADMVAQVEELVNGRLDGVIACAGIGGGQNPPGMVLPLNFSGVRATLDGLRPFLAAGSEPRAVAVASIAALSPGVDAAVAQCLRGDVAGAVASCAGDGVIAYAIAKRAIARWARIAAIDHAWAGAGIALNVVAPGMILTPMSEYYLGSESQRADALARAPQPFKGIGAPGDIARLIVWLVSTENQFVAGQLIFADGGYEASVCPGEVPVGSMFRPI